MCSSKDNWLYPVPQGGQILVVERPFFVSTIFQSDGKTVATCTITGML